MTIKKYRPNFFSGFEDVYYEVNSKEELLASELCRGWVNDGYEICFSKNREDYGNIMAIKQDESDEDGAEWWVLAIIKNEQDIKTLTEWLPDYVELVKKYYELKYRL